MSNVESNRRAKKLISELKLTATEIQQIIATAQVQLATFDPDYRTNVTQIAVTLAKSRPTVYGWADKSLEASVAALRTIRTGRPPKSAKSTLVAPKYRKKDQ